MNNYSEAQAVLDNPLDFSDEVQKNYFGFCHSEYVEPEGEDINTPIPEGMEEYFSEVYNPYTKQRKTIRLFKEKTIDLTQIN